MSALIESYKKIDMKLSEFTSKIDSAEREIEKLTSVFSANTAVRISKIEEQIARVDDYLSKIKEFQKLAKQNLDSQNILTIEAPPGYRINLNRLRNWAMMIDPMSPNDPYAQRVYVVAKCDEHFLNKKRQEFIERIQQLKEGRILETSDEIEKLKESVVLLKEEQAKYVTSSEMKDFTKAVVSENNKYWHVNFPKVFQNPDTASKRISPGACAVPLFFEKEQRLWLKSVMGNYYDAEEGRVFLPVELSNKYEYLIRVNCSPSRRKNLDEALQNLILATINENPVGTRKIHIIDGIRFNASSIGTLYPLERTSAIERIPRNPKQLTSTLERFVSSFADIDKIIEGFDSVTEFNAVVEMEKRLPLTTMIVFGWPNSYERRDRELLRKIMTNYERYGISLITVSYGSLPEKMKYEPNVITKYAWQNVLDIDMSQGKTTATFSGGISQNFTWYVFSDALSHDFISSYKMQAAVQEQILT